MRIGPPTFIWANIFSQEQLQKRYESTPASHVDFLSKFLEVKKKQPELVNDNTIILYLLSNVLAGSDSTAGTMCATIYYVLKNPSVHAKLRAELRGAGLSLPAKWKDIHGLKYLEAVMRESMRINPGVGLMIERVVPSGGLTLPDGRFVPEGTIVGMNPWVINRNKEVFGADTDSFIPERWLKGPGESEEAFQARFAKMKATDFTFGAGSRACLGRNLSQLESYKLVATLFSSFDVSCLDVGSRGLLGGSLMLLRWNFRVRSMSGSLLILGLFGRRIFLFVWLRGRIWLFVFSFVFNDSKVSFIFQLRMFKELGRSWDIGTVNLIQQRELHRTSSFGLIL